MRRSSPARSTLSAIVRLTGRYKTLGGRSDPWNRSRAADVDVLVVGAGITGIYQLYRAREAGFSALLLEAGGGVGRHLVLEPLPRRAVRLRELHLRLPVLEGAVRRLGVAGALRRATGDRALPQPRGRPVRPPAPHALRRAGHLGGVRRGVGHLGGDGRRRHRASAPGSSIAATGVLSVPYTPRRARDATTSAACSTTPGCGRRSRSTSPASASRSSARRRAACRSSRPSSTTSSRVTVYQRTANWCTPLNNRPITAEEQAELRAGFEDAPRDAEHVAQRVRPPGERARRVRRLRRRAAGVLREAVEQPGLHEAHEQLLRPAVQRGGERRVVRVHRREDPRHRARPRDGRAADPEGPPVRREATSVRQRVLRGVQRPEGVARRSPGDAHRARDRDGDRDDRRRARVRHHRVGDRLRLRHRRAQPHGDPRSRRARAHRALGRRPDAPSSVCRPAGSRTSSSPVDPTPRPATTRGTTATWSTSSPTRSSTRPTTATTSSR